MRADRVLSAISGLLNWYADQSDDFVNPLARTKRYINAKENARDRVLNDAELRQLWVTAASHDAPYGAFLQFVLLTGTRRGDVSGAVRAERYKAEALQRANALAPIFNELKQQGLSLRAMAAELTKRKVPTPQGNKTWHPQSVACVIERLAAQLVR